MKPTATYSLLQRMSYKLLYRLTSGLRMRIISDNGEPYLERYYVGSLLGTRVYVHRFVASDPMRGHHDHPWQPALSIVLWGEYGEERINVSQQQHDRRGYVAGDLQPLHIKYRIVRWFNWLTFRTAHRVVVGNDWTPTTNGSETPTFYARSPECWSLFIHHSKYTTGWGFWRPKNNTTYGDLRSWLSFQGTPSRAVVTSGNWWQEPKSVPSRDMPDRVKPLDL